MSESVLRDKSKEFAIDIVNLCREIKEKTRESILTRQLIRSGTSVGANIYEAAYAQSKADFISKLKIALKECYESEYWMDILYETNYIEGSDEYIKIRNKCGGLRRMLIASINTAVIR